MTGAEVPRHQLINSLSPHIARYFFDKFLMFYPYLRGREYKLLGMSGLGLHRIEHGRDLVPVTT
jgi:hypothetical protein